MADFVPMLDERVRDAWDCHWELSIQHRNKTDDLRAGLVIVERTVAVHAV